MSKRISEFKSVVVTTNAVLQSSDLDLVKAIRFWSVVAMSLAKNTFDHANSVGHLPPTNCNGFNYYVQMYSFGVRAPRGVRVNGPITICINIPFKIISSGDSEQRVSIIERELGEQWMLID